MLVAFKQNGIEKYKVKYNENGDKFKTTLKVDYESNISKVKVKSKSLLWNNQGTKTSGGSSSTTVWYLFDFISKK